MYADPPFTRSEGTCTATPAASSGRMLTTSLTYYEQNGSGVSAMPELGRSSLRCRCFQLRRRYIPKTRMRLQPHVAHRPAGNRSGGSSAWLSFQPVALGDELMMMWRLVFPGFHGFPGHLRFATNLWVSGFRVWISLSGASSIARAGLARVMTCDQTGSCNSAQFFRRKPLL